MSQDQPQRQRPHHVDPIKYGGVFNVSGELASKPVAPGDAAAVQAAETVVFGQTRKGGPAAVMQSAADVNLSLGVVGHDDVTDKAREQGVTIAQGFVAGHPFIAEAVGEQVLVGGYVERGGGGGGDREEMADRVTIGEALEAAALTGEDRAIDTSDAAAIQAAEVRATGRRQVVPGGVGAEAQAAAMKNRRLKDEDKTKLADVLTDASDKLPRDKEVTREDALGIVAAEIRNDPNIRQHEDGVAKTMLAAARLNQQP